jgi:hypothetical protein
MQVDDIKNPRFEKALDVFEEHGTMKFRDLHLDRRAGALRVDLESSWSLENTDRERAKCDLRRARQNIEALQQASPRFARLVGGLPLRIVLFHWYGTGGVDICEETSEGLRWLAAAVAADGASRRR